MTSSIALADINQKWPFPVNRGGQLGTYTDEVHQSRQLEKNPEASPMPAAAPGQFLDPKASSDNLRMGAPNPVSEDPFEASQVALFHVIFRRLLTKRRKRGWKMFQAAVDEEELGEMPQARREQMRSMLRRERAMLDILDRYNSLAEDVYARLLSESKG